MEKKKFGLFTVIVLSILILSACTGSQTTSTPVNTPTLTQTNIPSATPTATLSVAVGQSNTALTIIERHPIQGERLALSPAIKFVFNQAVDQQTISQAWVFTDEQGVHIDGDVQWSDQRTFVFTPAFKLSPESTYLGSFDSEILTQDGITLDGQLSYTYLTEEPISISQTFPEDQTQDVEASSSITVIFNKPIVPLTIIEDRDDFPHPLIFSPNVEGTGEWINSSVYIFYPNDTLKGDTTYAVTIDDTLTDVSGNQFAQSYTWQFTTRTPQITNLELRSPYWNPINPDTNALSNINLQPGIRISFSQPMDQNSVESALTITDRESMQDVAYISTWDEEFTSLKIELESQLNINSYYHLTLTTAASAKNGGTINKGLDFDINTLSYPSVLSTNAHDPDRTERFMPWVTVRFATPMDFETIKDRVVVSPESEEEINIDYSNYSNELFIYGLTPSTENIIRLLPGMQDIYGNEITTEYSFTVNVIDRPTYANMLLPWTPLIYREQGIQDVYFEFTNLDQGEIAIYELSFSQFRNLFAYSNPNDFYPSNEPLNTWDIEGDADKNQTIYKKINLETQDGESLAPGYYFIGLQSDQIDYDDHFYQARLFIVGTDNITLKSTKTEGFAWVTDLESGHPQADQKVIFYDEDFNAIASSDTDQDGIVYLDQLEARPQYARIYGDDQVALTSIYWGSGISTGDFGIWQSYYGSSASIFGYLQTDRPLYRPGQTVQFNGIIRHQDDLHYTLVDWEEVYVEIEHQGEIIYEKNLSVTSGGNFTGEFDIADAASLGTYYINVYSVVPEKEFVRSISFRVAEYHKPEFQVNVDTLEQQIMVEQEATFTLDASYYAGGNLANATVDWYLESNPYYFVPASDYQRFTFTDWDRDIYRTRQTDVNQNNTIAQGQSTTDQNGHLEITQQIPANDDQTSQSLYFGVNITDVAGNLVSGSTNVVAHQNKLYVGIDAQQYIGHVGEAQAFDLVVLDWQSKPIANQPITIEFFERQWYSVQEKDDQGVLRWKTSVKEIPVTQRTVTTDQDGFATADFIPPNGGVFKALATVHDENGNQHQTSSYVWVAGNSSIAWRQKNDRSFDLVSDKDLYAPGETAEILIAQPFEGENYALITYERGHIYHSEVVLLENNSTIYKMPITTEMTPITYLSVIVINGAETGDRPNFKVGMLPINVDTNQKTLQVSVTTQQKTAQPGDDITYLIETKDANGDPVSANVTLSVVDQAILSLTSSNVSPIVQSFYPKEALYVRTASGIVLSADEYNVDFRETIQDGVSSGGGGNSPSQGIVTVRQDFKDTVVFETNILTDENGTAEVTVSLPENLTTWQATARAVTEDSRVGQATSQLLSTKPLYVNLTTPRFFVVNDQVVIGANVHNNTDQERTVEVELEAIGLSLATAQTQTIEVPAQQQAYLIWNGTVEESAQRVDLTVYADSGREQDASKPALGTLSDQGIPVYNFTVEETVGTAGMITTANSITEGIYLPQSIDYNQAEIAVEISPSLSSSMTEGLTYLRDYPYLCMEQTVSRFLPNVILSRALEARGIPSPINQNDLETQINTALQRIYAKQQSDGGWAWWDNGESDPYVTAYVVYGLVEAQESYPISEEVLENGISYLNRKLPLISTNISTSALNRYTFITYTLAKAGESSPRRINAIYTRRDNISTYAKAYLLQTIHLYDPQDSRIQTLLADIHADAIVSSSGTHWEEQTIDYRNWNTDVRTTAIVLNALVQVEGENAINVNAVRWLMAHRELGRWSTTQENVWSLIALTNWMTHSGELDADYDYAIGLNGELLATGEVNQDNLDQNIKLNLELDQLLLDQQNALVFTRGAGEGNLYYTTSLTASLAVDQIEALDQGMSVSRQYFTLEDGQTPITEIEQGELVRVRVTMVVPGALHFVVVNDPLPAGFEAVDSTLNTDANIPSFYSREISAERGWGWWHFDHIEKRDEKVVLVADYLPAGTYVYTYVARASTVGTFNVIPTTASEFYFPDVGGRGAGSKFTVLP